MAIFRYPPTSISVSTVPANPLDVRLSDGSSSYNTVKESQLPASLGQKTAAASLSIVPASDAGMATESTLSSLNAKVTKCDTDNVKVIENALPTGAATETTLSALNAKVTACDTGNVTVGASALPSGAATESSLSGLSAKVTKVDTDNVKVIESALPTGAATESTLSGLNTKVTKADTDNVVVTSSALPTGAATEATLSAQSAKLPASLGQKNMAASFSVTIASDQNTIKSTLSGKTATAKATLDYESTTVTDSAYVELIADTGSAASEIEIFDSSGQVGILALGPASSEVDQIYISPGGNGRIPLSIPANSRISLKALDADLNTGLILVNFYG